MKREICPHCGQKMPIRNRHALNKMLIDAMIKLYKYGKPMKVAEIGLSHNQQANFQKLQYWGIVRRVSGCRWEVTAQGEEFLLNKVAVYEKVITQKNSPQEYDGERKYVCDITGVRYLQREDYVYA